MNPFPIFLNDLAGRPCVMFGTGHEAERKVDTLLEYGASVTVINPDLSPPLQQHFEAGDIAWRARSYRPGDLKNVYLAIVSEPNPTYSRPIWEEAEAEHVLFNAMDDVQHCNFVSGSVIKRGPLVISISTSGCAPALAVRLRQRFEKEFGPEYGTYLELMKSLRPVMQERFTEFEERRKKWYELVDGPLFEILKAGTQEDVDRFLEDFFGYSIAHHVHAG